MKTKKVIIKNEHFKNSSGYSHNHPEGYEMNPEIQYRCPLWGALFQETGKNFIVGYAVVFQRLAWFNDYYRIPTDIWNSETVQPLVDKAKAGIVVPDFELELEIIER